MTMKRKKLGFTLIEFIIAIAIAGILLSAAVPSFITIINNNRIESETNRFIADIRLARSEAMKRGVRVILCRSSDPDAAAPSCAGNTRIWTNGWLLFADGSAGGNSTFEAAADVLLKVGQVPEYNNFSIKSNNTATENLVFRPDATTDEGGNTASFAICDSRGANHGKLIEVPPIGRPRLAAAVTNCNNPT